MPGASLSSVSVERCASSSLFYPWPRRHCRPVCCAPLPPPPPIPPCRPAVDAAECRILLNRAQREIDRLRLGLDEYRFNRKQPSPVNQCEIIENRPDRAVDSPCATSTRASPPLGRIDLSLQPKYESRPVFLNIYPVVTNLGTLIDVLL
jgi:hypothetical protein